MPQHDVVELPALSPTMSQGTLVSWEKKEGDEVKRGDVVAQVETDKATMDMEVPRHGFIAKFLVGAGTKDIPLGMVSTRECVCVCVCALSTGRERVQSFVWRGTHSSNAVVHTCVFKLA